MHVDRSYLHIVTPALVALPSYGVGKRVGEAKDSLSQDPRRERQKRSREDTSEAGNQALKNQFDAEPARKSEHALDITV